MRGSSLTALPLLPLVVSGCYRLGYVPPEEVPKLSASWDCRTYYRAAERGAGLGTSLERPATCDAAGAITVQLDDGRRVEVERPRAVVIRTRRHGEEHEWVQPFWARVELGQLIVEDKRPESGEWMSLSDIESAEIKVPSGDRGLIIIGATIGGALAGTLLFGALQDCSAETAGCGSLAPLFGLLVGGGTGAAASIAMTRGL